jgi:WG containing repeat
MLRPVKLEGRWGFAWGYQNEEGQLVVPPYFAEAREFSEGMAAVKFVCSWGYIDEQGKVAIAPMFDDADIFLEGIAKVKVGSKYGFINQRGEFYAVKGELFTDSKTDTAYLEDDMDTWF